MERGGESMALCLLIVAFWVPFLAMRMMGHGWGVALIAGSVACGSLFTYLIFKSYKAAQIEAEEEMTALERAEMAM
jgi:hypothetical protein